MEIACHPGTIALPEHHSGGMRQPASHRIMARQSLHSAISYSRIANCIALRYTTLMIKSFHHRGLKGFFETGSKAGIQPHHATKLARQLKHLDRSKCAEDMNIPGWNLHPLSQNLSGHWSVWVNGNWRLTFAFDGEDAILVNYQDYH